MTHPNAQLSYSGEELVSALDALDVPFLVGGAPSATRKLSPTDLMVGLAQSPEARVRSALVPLLLRRPELAQEARLAATRLQPSARHTLELFYTAAMLLRRKYSRQLNNLFGAQPILPDLFGQTLGLSLPNDPDESLQLLARRHAQLTGLDLNWIATYEHAVERLIRYAEKRQKWDRRTQVHTR